MISDMGTLLKMYLNKAFPVIADEHGYSIISNLQTLD